MNKEERVRALVLVLDVAVGPTPLDGIALADTRASA